MVFFTIATARTRNLNFGNVICIISGKHHAPADITLGRNIIMGFYIRLDQGYGNPFPEAKVIGV
jgi:hypothetical protein